MTSRRTLGLLVCAMVGGCGDDGGSAGPDAGGDPDGGVTSCLGDRQLGDLADGAWDARFTISGLGGHDGIAPTIFDFARAPDGAIFAAGRFQWFEGHEVAPLMKHTASGWEPARTTWELTPPGAGFAAIAIAADGDLALATNDDFGDRRTEIWIDDGGGLRSVGAMTGQVRSLAWFDGKLWVAGRYTMGEGAAAIEHLATWDGAVWAAPPGGASDDAVYELTLDGDGLLVGGAFRNLGGRAAAKVARYDGDSWTTFDLPGGLAVFALTRGGDGTLYAGGSTVELDGSVAAGGLMQWTGTAWAVVGGGVATRNLPGVVSDVIAHDGVVDAIGCFMAAGGAFESKGAVTVRDIARWNGTSWQVLDDGSSPLFAPWFTPLVCGDEGPAAIWDAAHQRLAVSGGTLFHGGMMAGGGDALSQALVAYDGTTWVAQGQSGAGIGGALDRVAASPDSCDVYGFGLFSHVAGTPSQAHLLRFAGDAWHEIADTLTRDSFCLALAAGPGGAAAVGCIDSMPDGTPYSSVLRVEGDRLVRAAVELPGIIQTLTYDAGGTLWITGGGETGFLARLDGDVLTVVEDGFDGVVTRVDARGGNDVVVGGSFTHVDGVAANRIARWDGAAWSALGDGLPGQVHALARDGDTVYASTYEEGNGFLLVGEFDGTAWHELATAANGLTAQDYFSVEQFQMIDGALVAVGTLELDDASGSGVMVYRDGAFRSLGGGVRAMSVGGIAASADAVWAAGWIAEAGTGATRVPSIGVARWIRATR